MLGLVNRLFVTLCKFFAGDDMIFEFFLKDRICQKITHQDHIFDILIFQIQSLKGCQIITDKFLDQLVVMRCRFFQFFQPLTNTHASHLETLRRYQRILVKQRYLKITSTNIKDRRSFLNDLFESGFNRSNRFVSQKMLLGIA